MSWTYTTLKSAIGDYVDSAETTFTNNYPVFIKEAEERILKNVQIPVFRKNVTGNGASGNTYLAAPSDYLTPLSLAVIDGDSNYNYLLLKQVTFIRDYTPAAATTGEPLYYAEFDDNTFILAPTPNSNFTFELHYVYRPESITASSDGTSWLGTNAPDTLLYGCLIEAYTFMKGEPDVISLYDQRYKEALQQLIIEGDGRNRKDAYRSGQIRIQGV